MHEAWLKKTGSLKLHAAQAMLLMSSGASEVSDDWLVPELEEEGDEVYGYLGTAPKTHIPAYLEVSGAQVGLPGVGQKENWGEDSNQLGRWDHHRPGRMGEDITSTCGQGTMPIWKAHGENGSDSLAS